MEKQQGIMLPLVASVGIGAAAFYSMTRGQGVGQTVQQFVPLVAGIGSNKNKNQNKNDQLMDNLN